MNCAACGAPWIETRGHCPVCGRTGDEKASEKWDRAPEALLYESLNAMLKDEETLLSSTRGRIAGTWRSRANFSPFAFIAPYANVGLTANRILVQQVHPRTGEAVANSGTDFALKDIASVHASDADPFEPGQTVRLTVLRNDGESFRIRAVGRLAEAACGFAEVWQTLTAAVSRPPSIHCSACNRALDRVYRFCPFCGAEQAEQGES